MANNREYRDDIYLNDTNFAFSRNVNFAGVEDRNFGKREAAFKLTEEQYAWFIEQGYNAKDRAGNLYISAKINFKDPEDPNKNRYDPKVYLVTDPTRNPIRLAEEDMETIDNLAANGLVKNVCVRLHPGYVDRPTYKGWALYISEIYVEQDMDADIYHKRYFVEDNDVPGNDPF